MSEFKRDILTSVRLSMSSGKESFYMSSSFHSLFLDVLSVANGKIQQCGSQSVVRRLLLVVLRFLCGVFFSSVQQHFSAVESSLDLGWQGSIVNRD